MIFFRSLMWLNRTKTTVLDDSDVDSVSSGEEIPIWVRGEQRWVSGISEDTSCHDVIRVLLHDEELRVSTPFVLLYGYQTLSTPQQFIQNRGDGKCSFDKRDV